MDTHNMTLLALFATFVGLVVALVGLFLLRSIINYTRQIAISERHAVDNQPPAPLRICNLEICWHRVERTSNIMISIVGVASAMVFIQMLSLL